MHENLTMSWSGGKDCALALHDLLHSSEQPAHRFSGLLTTLTEGYDRVTMHGVRRELIEHQAEALDLAFDPVYIPKQASMERYEQTMREALCERKREGSQVLCFGDIHLKDVKKRRMDFLEQIEITSRFPLWGREPGELMKDILERGFKVVTVCVASDVLDRSFVGQVVDESYLERLPEGVDACGENGEFHTFVIDGPMFRHPVDCKLGEVVEREAFYFCDLLPGS